MASSHVSCPAQAPLLQIIVMYNVVANAMHKLQAVSWVVCSVRISQSICGMQRRWPQANAGNLGTCPPCLLCHLKRNENKSK